jgi:NitT/TauT family transport system ATP-binding protein
MTEVVNRAVVSHEVMLSIQHVSHEFRHRRYGIVSALHDVNFDVATREFVAVVGPSGCGKTTLLNLLAGFDQPSTGVLLHRGVPITRPRADRGVVFQTPALYPWFSVLENVMFGLKATGRGAGGERRALAILDEMSLRGFAEHRPYELSGGMQHRVSLARTLVTEPEVLLMDEPFAALDAQTRSEMQELLLRLWQRRQSTVVFITHDIEEALLLADRVMILSDRPGTVRHILESDFPRPRSYDVVGTDKFGKLRIRVRSLLEREIRHETQSRGA